MATREVSYNKFCPEIIYDEFGFFASDLGHYYDAQERDLAHQYLTRDRVADGSWQWTYPRLTPRHFTECDVYSQLFHSRDVLVQNPLSLPTSVKQEFRHFYTQTRHLGYEYRYQTSYASPFKILAMAEGDNDLIPGVVRRRRRTVAGTSYAAACCGMDRVARGPPRPRPDCPDRHSFARIGAALAMKVEYLFVQNRRL